MDPTVFILDTEIVPLVMALRRLSLKWSKGNRRQNILRNAGVDDNFIGMLDIDASANEFANELVAEFRAYHISQAKPDYHPLLKTLRYLIASSYAYQLLDREQSLFQTLIQRGEENCKVLAARSAVGQIESPQGHPLGTGMLIGKDTLLTCAHVFNEHENQPLWVRFGYLPENEPGFSGFYCELDTESLIRHPRPDHALIKLKDLPAIQPLVPRKKRLDRGENISLVHHPGGRPMEVSDRAQIADVGVDFIVYSLLTERGSSGAPIFDKDWQPVAMHRGEAAIEHSDKGSLEGIPLSAIWSRLVHFVPEVKE